MTEIVLTPDTYARWLQAQRPPFEWFVMQPEEEQKVMAEQGAIHRIDGYIEQAKAIHNPTLYEAQVYPDDPDSEGVRLQHLVNETIHQLQHRGAAPQTPEDAPESTQAEPRTSMAGVLATQEANTQARIKATGELRTFLGMRPDAVREASA